MATSFKNEKEKMFYLAILQIDHRNFQRVPGFFSVEHYYLMSNYNKQCVVFQCLL